MGHYGDFYAAEAAARDKVRAKNKDELLAVLKKIYSRLEVRNHDSQYKGSILPLIEAEKKIMEAIFWVEQSRLSEHPCNKEIDFIDKKEIVKHALFQEETFIGEKK